MSEPDLTDEELTEDGDDSAEYQPGNPDHDGQDAARTGRPETNKHSEKTRREK
jgi:hypothetical protein